VGKQLPKIDVTRSAMAIVAVAGKARSPAGAKMDYARRSDLICSSKLIKWD